MASFRLTALLFASLCLCQMVAVLGFVAPKTSSIAVGSSSSEGFAGEAWQGSGQRRGRSCAVASRREMDTTMRLGVSARTHAQAHSPLRQSVSLRVFRVLLCCSAVLGESKLQSWAVWNMRI